jgi:predicted RNase H-like HicB family nuclease
MARRLETVRITISYEDGCFYISSEDVEGLWLWGRDPALLFGNLGPAIKTLYRYNKNMEIEVRESLKTKISRWLLCRIHKPVRKPSTEKLDIYASVGQQLTTVHG